MVAWYWASEYIKVLAGYTFLMFIWPTFMLRKYLKGRSITFLFGFCVTFQTVLISTVVMILGLFHLLNIWVLRALFYIPFLIGVVRWLGWGKTEARNLKYLVNGTYGVKLFCHNLLRNIGKRVGGFFDIIRRRLHTHWWEYGLLFVIVVYGMIYFSWGVFQNYSYGASDMYVHNAWVYELVQGKVFPSGVYPEGMHGFVYGLHALFGIRIYSCMLFLQPIHVAVFLLAVHVFLKELFRWKYTSLFVLTAFLTLDVLSGDSVYSMARLQWTLPQEFGMPAVFLCAAFLLRYLRAEKQMMFRGKLTKGCWDENLLIFQLSLAASLTTHFYSTIMAFFLCLALVPIHFKRIFSRKRFMPLLAAVVTGVVVAVLPMAGAYATGIPLEGSLYWAMSIVEGSGGEQEDALQQGESAVKESREEPVRNKLEKLYDVGYVGVYQTKRAGLILCSTVLALLFWGCYRIFAAIPERMHRRKKREFKADYFDGYLSIVLASVIFALIFCAPELGLPTLLDRTRLYAVNQMLVLAVGGILLDIVFSFLRLVLRDSCLQVVSVAVVAGIYALVVVTGNYHGFLFVHLTRLNGAVLTTHSVTETLPPYSFTIVSPVDEMYQLIQYGYHEELLNFANQVWEKEYRLPSEHIFIFIEKTPIRYAQYHLVSGPKWLAREKYSEYYGFTYASQQPEYVCAELMSAEELGGEKYEFELDNQEYATLNRRTLAESVVYQWCQAFSALYPRELQTYYEDEQFICYYIRQNPQSLYQLGILYQEETE